MDLMCHRTSELTRSRRDFRSAYNREHISVILKCVLNSQSVFLPKSRDEICYSCRWDVRDFASSEKLKLFVKIMIVTRDLVMYVRVSAVILLL